MASFTLRTVLHRFGRSADACPAPPTPDQELLARFLGERDEQAFAALMTRHAGMVLGVCRRILRNTHDAEDACQAVFLVLARQAASIRKSNSLASWLHGVAWRAAHKLQARLARRRVHEAAAAADMPTEGPADDMSWRDLQRIIDEELNRLPKVYAAPLILCYLEGKTQDEAARELGATLPAVRGRLERGREMLRQHLTRRGVAGASALAIGALAPSLSSAATPAQLVASTAAASLPAAAGQALPLAVPARVAGLTADLLKTPILTNLTALGVGAVALVLVLAGICWPHSESAPTRQAALENWSPSSRLEAPKTSVWCVAFSRDGKRLAAGSAGPRHTFGELRVWDAGSSQLLYKVTTQRPVRCVAFAPDGKTLATAEHDGRARLRDAPTGEVIYTLHGRRTQIDTVSYSHDGAQVATSGWDQTIRIWDTVTGKLVRSLEGHNGQVFDVAFGGRDGILGSCGADSTARLWRATTGEALHTLIGHNDVVHWLAFSPADANVVATASWDKSVRLWDATTGTTTATMLGHTQGVNVVVFSADGKTLATAANERDRGEEAAVGEVILWDLQTRKARAYLPTDDRVFGLAFAPDGRTLATTGWDGAVTLWKQDAAAPLAVLANQAHGEFQFIAAQAQDDAAVQLKKNYAEDFSCTFADNAQEANGLRKYGPDVGDRVRFEAAGLRLRLPAGQPKKSPVVGVVTDFGVKGDFEITATFEILDEPNVGLPSVHPTEFRLVVVPHEPTLPDMWHSASQNRAELIRHAAVRGNGGLFLADASVWNNENIPKDQWGNELFNGIEQHAIQRTRALKKTGKLQFIRQGSVLYFLTSDDAAKEPALLHKHEFGAKDLKHVRLVGATGHAKAALDVRFTDFRIRADAFAKSAVDLAATSPVVGRKWPALRLTIGAGAVAVLLLTGTWLLVRGRAASSKEHVQPSSTSSIIFKCSGCGKNFKAKAERIGAKVKCPQCGAVTTVPKVKSNSTPE